MKINYITNLKLSEVSGGWSGMSVALFQQLEKFAEVNAIDGIDPPMKFSEKLASALLRRSGLQGKYPAFSSYRLRKIAKQVLRQINPHASFNFFHGATSWCAVRSNLPYACYLDASFADYIKVYHDRAQFQRKDLERIYRWEIEFLQGASVVFFSSDYALKKTCEYYQISGENFTVAGLGGAWLQEDKSMVKHKYFLFVGLDFKGKGGDILVEAFEKFRLDFPDYELCLVGEDPGETITIKNGIQYLGRLNKSDVGQLQRLKELYRFAHALVLPSKKDMTPLVLLEAASMACPVISVSSFGIPEMVKHEQTGILLHENMGANELASAMKRSCSDLLNWRKMGENAYRHANENYRWDLVGNHVQNQLNAIYLSGDRKKSKI